ncbi:MAG: alpha-1,4-glucan--maltose-1-phosphate maltosyltransferase [Saprospiraceae bacterium]|nr:alpha-1,4-glucan--maltose-1-phosphate maltosyltransferase [Saprospiraceae bacterium]
MLRDQNRAIIEHIYPALNAGEFPIKAVVNEIIHVQADVFSDGHDVVQAALKYKHSKGRNWNEIRMEHVENDRWQAAFTVDKQGFFAYGIEAWVDYALNWQHGIERKIADGQHVTSELLDGVQYLLPILKEADSNEKDYLRNAISVFQDENQYAQAVTIAQSHELHDLFVKYPSKDFLVSSDSFQIYTDREKARFSTWYEFFPRSTGQDGQHGTFKTCEQIVPRVAKMGFDTLYFPPIHPIGEVNRKGKNNATTAEPGDVGSPWGIGSKHGGHKSIHPELGSLQDFLDLIQVAKEHDIEIAMDFALQCAPDHPYVKEYPEWFRWRPDGTVQYAENPPKKYQDILPIYFETSDWKKLWNELLDACMYWVEHGIKVFRVDNPHTKPFRFWGWLINEVKAKHPDVLFLSEAFTKPKVMHQLAKQGFTQSYTYFTWRNSKAELIEYLTELTQTDQKYFFRPNFWPNTPDINPWSLQSGHEPEYVIRHFLAATLSSNYGLYGPVYEYIENTAVSGKEEYYHSEKYEVRSWDWTKENKLTKLITKINYVRKAHKALQQTNNIHFCSIENDKILAYYKWDQNKDSHVLAIVNLDSNYTQQGWVQVPYHLLGKEVGTPLSMNDLITGNQYTWNEEWCFVELSPDLPYHLFEVKFD